MTDRSPFSLAVPLWVLACALVVMWEPASDSAAIGVIRLVLCAPLVLYLPGSMLVDVLRIEGDLVTRITLAVFLSFAVCILSGFLLHLAGRLDPSGWTFALGLVTIAAWCANGLRPPEASPPSAFRLWPGFLRLLIFVVAGTIATSAVLVARQGALAQKQFNFTELWMVPKQTSASNIVTIGVRNSEEDRNIYSLDLVLGGAVIGQMPPFDLAPAASRTFEFSVPMNSQAPKRLEAWLYKGRDRGTIYRKVWVTIGSNQSFSSAEENPADPASGRSE